MSIPHHTDTAHPIPQPDVGADADAAARVAAWLDHLLAHNEGAYEVIPAPPPAAQSWVHSLADVMQSGDVDLRRKGDANALERGLEVLDLERIIAAAEAKAAKATRQKR